MRSEATYKLLAHLYQIVPARETQGAISREVFSDEDEFPVDAILSELMHEGYIYQWKNYSEEDISFSVQDEYGMTPKGIVFFDQYEDDKGLPASPVSQQETPVEKNIPPAETDVETTEEKESYFSFRRVIPVIILIAFAVGLIWFITHLKNSGI